MIAMLFLIKFINDWEKRLFSKASKVLFLENLLIFRNNWLLKFNLIFLNPIKNIKDIFLVQMQK